MRIYFKFKKILLFGVFIIGIVIFLFHNIQNSNANVSYDDSEMEYQTVISALSINISLYKYRLQRHQMYQNNQYNQKGPGENGNPVTLTNEDIKNLESVMKKEAFNRPVSDRVSLQRSLPDFRSTECKAFKYPKDLPTTSVIIIFHNEAFSALLRTAYSVVHRSPPQYLREVILLDDASYSVGLGTNLDSYVRQTWPDEIVRVERSNKRLGLIRARLEGAKLAQGDVLVFLDSHCEVTEGWLLPILYRIKQKRETMIIPVIENIDARNLAYYGSSELGHVGTFWWSMHFTWDNVPSHFKKEIKSKTDYVKSATMAGGLFASERKYFFEIGSYDDGMEIWGGENLEISFRVWMCGGTLESTPCSHVGHIFRASHPYTFPGNKDYHGLNSKRMVDVWLDEYKSLFYMNRPDLKNADAGSIASRIELRQQLNCKSFDWFVKNVVPEKFIPTKNVLGYGFVRNPVSNMCLDLLGQNEYDRGYLNLGLYYCQGGKSGAQIFSLAPINYSLVTSNSGNSEVGQLRREWGCVTSTMHYKAVLFLTCQPGPAPNQLWIYSKVDQSLVNVKLGQCLDTTGLKNLDTVLTKPCDSNNSYQKWVFQFQ